MSSDLAWIVPAALGALGLLSVAAWQLAARLRFRRRLRGRTRRLASFDSEERARGGVAVVELGLNRRTATVLLGHVAAEDDRRVRLTIAQEVARRDERSRRRRVRRLRAWAADELAAQGGGAKPAPSGEQKKQKKKPPRIRWRAPASQS